MNFNFRKIASVLASTVMIGSTVGMAAAASFPQPFVAGGRADVAIVTGVSAAASDTVAAVNIATKLNEHVTRGVATGGSTTVTGGDFVKLERSSDKFNLGNQADDFYATIDSEELSTVLADGTYLNEQNDEFEYEQDIVMAPMTLTHFLDSSFNDEKPAIGFNLDSGAWILNYTLDFTTAAEGGTAFADLENTNIEMLGKEFFISDVVNGTNGIKITLLDAANTIQAEDGETQTVTVGGVSYEVTPKVYSATNVKFTVNGETTNSLNEGNTFKLSDGTYVGVKEINYNSKDSGVSDVEFSLGTGKIVLENNQEVEVNEDPISDIEDENGYKYVVTSRITDSESTDLDQIVLEWKTDDDAWVAPGYDLVMPGFNTIKFSMGGFTMPGEETTEVKDNGDSVSISTELIDGPVDFSILYANAGVTAFAGLGEDSDHKLVTNASNSPTMSLNETENTYFAATWVSGDDFESNLFEIGSITDDSGKNKTTLDSLAGDSVITFAEVGDVEDYGQIRFTLVDAQDTSKTARIKISPTGSGTVNSNLVVSKEGLRLRLPVIVNNSVVDTGIGYVNISGVSMNETGDALTSSSTTFLLEVAEEDNDDNIASGAKFNITLGLDSGDGTEPTATTVNTYDEEEDSDIEVGYVVSDLATHIKFTNPSDGLNNMELTYAGSESYAEVYLSEVSASVTSDSNGTTVSSVMSVKDNEVASVMTKNLVVVGGSCINTYAAKLLGSSTPLCGTAFTQKTNVAAGQYLIQTFASETTGKIATLVAGYNADDTTNAATYLTTQTNVDTTVGKKYVGTTSTSATLQTQVA